MQKLSHIFDFSTLNPSHILYNTQNQGISGLFKWEYPFCVEFIKLRSKTYAIKNLCSTCETNYDEYGDDICSNCNQNTTVRKGVLRNTETPFSCYVNALEKGKEYAGEYYAIVSKSQNVELVKKSKTFLKCLDFKRRWDPDSINSSPFGFNDTSSYNGQAGGSTI